MDERNIIQRAFELAGTCGSLVELRERLKEEGFAHVEAHIGGRLTRSQLRERLNPHLVEVYRAAKREEKRNEDGRSKAG